MAQIGRNDPCPCGSGKKYKKCCREADEQGARERMRAANALTLERDAELRALVVRRVEVDARRRHDELLARGALLEWEEDDLDPLSNSVLDFIKERRFDEALAACERLRREYPDVADGFERSALVHDALGNHALAADFWTKAVDFIEDPVRRDGYDEELIDDYRQRRDAARARAAPAEAEPTAEAQPTPSDDHERAP